MQVNPFSIHAGSWKAAWLMRNAEHGELGCCLDHYCKLRLIICANAGGLCGIISDALRLHDCHKRVSNAWLHDCSRLTISRGYFNRIALHRVVLKPSSSTFYLVRQHVQVHWYHKEIPCMHQKPKTHFENKNNHRVLRPSTKRAALSKSNGRHISAVGLDVCPRAVSSMSCSLKTVSSDFHCISK